MSVHKSASDKRPSASKTASASASTADAPMMVSATEIADFTYCPESWRLNATGAALNPAAQRRLREGEREHARWQHRQDLRDQEAFRGGTAPRRRVWAVVLGVLVFLAILWALFADRVPMGGTP